MQYLESWVIKMSNKFKWLKIRFICYKLLCLMNSRKPLY